MKEFSGASKAFTKVNSHRSLSETEHSPGPGFHNRHIDLDVIWKKTSNNSIVSVSFPNTSNAQLKKYQKVTVIDASSIIEMVFESAGVKAGITQTLAAYTFMVDMKGSIPASIVNVSIPNILLWLSTMRQFFDKSRKIDKAERGEIISAVKRNADIYSESENALITSCKNMPNAYEKLAGRKKVRSQRPLPYLCYFISFHSLSLILNYT